MIYTQPVLQAVLDLPLSHADSLPTVPIASKSILARHHQPHSTPSSNANEKKTNTTSKQVNNKNFKPPRKEYSNIPTLTPSLLPSPISIHPALCISPTAIRFDPQTLHRSSYTAYCTHPLLTTKSPMTDNPGPTFCIGPRSFLGLCLVWPACRGDRGGLVLLDLH